MLLFYFQFNINISSPYSIIIPHVFTPLNSQTKFESNNRNFFLLYRLSFDNNNITMFDRYIFSTLDLILFEIIFQCKKRKRRQSAALL